MLFSPLKIGKLKLLNRIVVSPMCQYSSINGEMNSWHMQHLTQLGMSGAGLVMVESTAVEKRGRITNFCLGLYNDKCESTFNNVLHAIKKHSIKGTKFGIQLNHAGRKASSQRPWDGRASLKKNERPWITVAPSPIPFDQGWHIPQSLSNNEISNILNAYISAAVRAKRLGFDLIEIHGAHGYLLNQFLSPISNRRTDKWGGSLENRMRFPLTVFKSIKDAVNDISIGFRITGTEWEENGINVKDAIVFSKELKKLGCSYVCVSSGGNTPNPKIPIKPHYQVFLAEQIKKNVKITTRTVGMITNPKEAEKIVKNNQADLVALGRIMLSNPRWVWDASDILNFDLKIPFQYQRRFKKT